MANETDSRIIITKAREVLRILSILHDDEYLSSRLALHGGTGLNEFVFDVPRLSTDADITVLTAPDIANTPELRQSFAERIRAALVAEGYRDVSLGEDNHAGRTMRITFRNQDGEILQTKIDLIFMSRVPILDPDMKYSTLNKDVSFNLMHDFECISGKVKAVLERTAPRDLIDISNSAKYAQTNIGSKEDEIVFHKVCLFYAAASRGFPQDFFGAEIKSFSSELQNRFLGLRDSFSEIVTPYLRGALEYEFNDYLSVAEQFMIDYVDPRNDEESEFLKRFAAGRYDPELLFEGDQLFRAKHNPEILWRLNNIVRWVGPDASFNDVMSKIIKVNNRNASAGTPLPVIGLPDELRITDTDHIDLEPEELAEKMAAQDAWYAEHPDAAIRDGRIIRPETHRPSKATK